MNIQNLVGLATQQKPSDYLAKAIPSDPKAGLTKTLNAIEKDGEANASDTVATDDTQNIETPSTSDTSRSVTSSQQGEEFTTFLTLLTAQIKNQDPLAPLDSTQFVEQLATFSNLELQASGNAVLEDIAQMLAQSLYNQNQEA